VAMRDLVGTEALFFIMGHKKTSSPTLTVFRSAVVIALKGISPAKPSRTTLPPRMVRMLKKRSKLKSKMGF